MNKLLEIKELTEHYSPHFIWIMEAYEDMNINRGYIHIRHLDIHQNHLFIREDIFHGRTISYIDYGIKVDDICFRYIYPGAHRTELDGRIEVGDYNPRSNKWINLENFNIEVLKNGEIGGM